MKYIHIKSLDKYHPGYRDRTLQWAKMYFNMVQGDPEFELIESEIDKWRYCAMVMLELKAKVPLPNIDRYWLRVGFDLGQRDMSLTLKMLQKFIIVVTEDELIEYIDKDKEEEKEIKIVLDTENPKIKESLIKFAEDFYAYNYKLFPNHLKDWKDPLRRVKMCADGADEIRKLIMIDGYTLPVIRNVLHWAVEDDFWQKNIIRLTGLRVKKPNGNIKFKNVELAMPDSAAIIIKEYYNYVCPDGCKKDQGHKTDLLNPFTKCTICGKKRIKEK